MTWILILFSYVGMMGHGDSNALSSVPGFHTKEEFELAGQLASIMATGTTKEIRFVCVHQRPN